METLGHPHYFITRTPQVKQLSTVSVPWIKDTVNISETACHDERSQVC